VKGGVPLTDAFADRTYNFVITGLPNLFGTPVIASQTTRFFSGSRSLVLGPTLEVQLPLGLAVEADALYRPVNINTQASTSVSTSILGLTVSTTTTTPVLPAKTDIWEFPLLAKYRLPAPFIKPYLEAGPVFRAARVKQLSNIGASAGIGVEARLGHFRIAPEIRYTHWGKDGKYEAPYYPVSYQNQLEFLAGISTAAGLRGATPRSMNPSRAHLFGSEGRFPVHRSISPRDDWENNLSSQQLSVVPHP
jgi:hypothetical protein